MAAPAKDRDSPILTAQAIDEIEQTLGDVGRGADFPLSRLRGDPTASRDGASSVLPPPARHPPSPPVPTRPPPPPPIPAEHRRRPQLPDVQAGDSLALPRTRPSRSRCVSAPGSSRKLGSLGSIEEGNWDHSEVPVLPFTALTATSTPAPATTPAPTPMPPGAPLLRQGEWQQEDWQKKVSDELARSARVRQRPARTPSTPVPAKSSLSPKIEPLPPPPSLPRASLQQNRFVSSSSATPSNASSSFSPAEGFPRLRQPQDLDPDSPYGYPASPAFRHNWETPNRASAQQSVNPTSTETVLGYTGPPVGSRSRPAPAVVPDPRPLPLLLAPSAPDSTASTIAGQFTYYPMMSPYEAEASMDVVGLSIYQNQSQHQSQLQAAQDNNEQQDWLMRPQAEARMFPVLDHVLMSAEQAAAAVAAATRVRNTIFIDRGFDVEKYRCG